MGLSLPLGSGRRCLPSKSAPPACRCVVLLGQGTLGQQVAVPDAQLAPCG